MRKISLTLALLCTTSAFCMESNAAGGEVKIDNSGLKAINMLLTYPDGRAALERCGRPLVESGTVRRVSELETHYVLKGHYLTGDIIEGSFTLTVKEKVKDPELGWIVHSHALNSDVCPAVPS